MRRLAFEAADSGLLSPELAAGIRRVKGGQETRCALRKLADRRSCRSLLRAPDKQTLKGRRDGAILAILLGCGLRRAEVAELHFAISGSGRNIGLWSI